jgi:hypothetical protein
MQLLTSRSHAELEERASQSFLLRLLGSPVTEAPRGPQSPGLRARIASAPASPLRRLFRVAPATQALVPISPIDSRLLKPAILFLVVSAHYRQGRDGTRMLADGMVSICQPDLCTDCLAQRWDFSGSLWDFAWSYAVNQRNISNISEAVGILWCRRNRGVLDSQRPCVHGERFSCPERVSIPRAGSIRATQLSLPPLHSVPYLYNG